MLQVRHLRTSVYHPQTDGLVERFKSFHQWMEKTGTSYFHTYYSLSGKYPRLPLASLPSSYSTADDREDYLTLPGPHGRINPPHTALSSNTWSRCEAGWHRSSPWSGNTSDEPNKHRPGCTIGEPKCAPSTRATRSSSRPLSASSWLNGRGHMKSSTGSATSIIGSDNQVRPVVPHQPAKTMANTDCPPGSGSPDTVRSSTHP